MSAGWTLKLFQCSDARRDTKQVESLFNNMKGPLSGGTIASLFGALLDNHGEDSKAVTDPYGLDPPDSRRGPDKGDSLLPGYSKLHKHFYFPFVMAPVNTRCVRRSNALLGHKYGERPLPVSLICQELPCPKWYSSGRVKVAVLDCNTNHSSTSRLRPQSDLLPGLSTNALAQDFTLKSPEL